MAERIPPHNTDAERSVLGSAMLNKDGQISGRASVDSPATITISGGEVTAVIVWSSPNYDFMMVDGQQYDPVNTEGNSVFEIPAAGFDCPMPVQADTTAMSQPHLIDYTLYFDSATITPAE